MDYQKVRSEKENSRMHQNDRNNLSWVKDIKTLKGNWTCMHSRRGRDRDRDQGHPKSRVSPEQVEIKMKKTNFIQRRKPLEEVWGKSPKWTPQIYIYIYSFKLVRAPCLFGWWLQPLALFVIVVVVVVFFFFLSDSRIMIHLPFACDW